jgi:hypothetical protein
MHRFVWDLHYAPPAVLQFSYPISAVYQNTPRMPVGTWVQPGTYTVKLTVNGQSSTQPLLVKMDPRVKTPAADMEQQFLLSMRLYEALREDFEALQQVRDLRAQLQERRARAGQGELEKAIGALDQKAAAFDGGGGPGGAGRISFANLNRELASVYGVLQGADVKPTTQAAAAVEELSLALTEQLARWQGLMAADVPSLNERLRLANLPPLKLEDVIMLEKP